MANISRATDAIQPPQDQVVSAPKASKGLLGSVAAFFRRISDPSSPIPEVGMVAGDPGGLLSGTRDLGNAIKDGSLEVSSDLGGAVSTLAAKVSGVAVGAMNLTRGVIQAEEGSNVDDGTRFYAGGVRIVRGVAEITKGGFGITSSSMQISGAAQSAKTALSALTIGSLVGVSLVQVAIGTTGYAYARELEKVATNFEKASTTDEKFKTLHASLEINDDDLTALAKDIKKGFFGQWFMGCFGDKRGDFIKQYRELYRLEKKENKTEKDQARIGKLKTKLAELAKDIEIKEPGDDQKKAFIGKIGEKSDDELFDTYVALELARLNEKKIKVFDRVFGQEVREKIHAMGEATPNDQVATVVKLASSKVTTSKWLYRLMMVTCALVFAVGIISKVLESLQITKPVFMILETALMLLGYLMILGIDLYFVKDSFKACANKKDKFMMVLLTLVNGFSNIALLLGVKMVASNLEFILPLATFGLFATWMLYKIIKMKKEKSQQEREPLLPSQPAGAVGIHSIAE